MIKYKIIFSLFIFISLMSEFLYAQDWANLNRFKPENTKLNSVFTVNNRVVFMGNSITEAWGSIYPEFFSNKAYVNRGIGGQTTPQMLIRFRSDVIDLKPEVVVILAGTNDIAGNTGPSTIKMISDNISSMAELASLNGIRVVLCSVLPVFDFPWSPGLNPSQKIIQLNEWIKDYAKKNDFIYLNYFSEMVDERKGLKKEYSEDGVHPNKKGYQVMSDLAEKAIAKAL